MHAWELVPRPEGKIRIIGSRFVFKTKWEEDCIEDCTPREAEKDKQVKNFVVKQFNARLVAQGYNLVEGVDYKASYAGCLALIQHARWCVWEHTTTCISSFWTFRISISPVNWTTKFTWRKRRPMR